MLYDTMGKASEDLRMQADLIEEKFCPVINAKCTSNCACFPQILHATKTSDAKWHAFPVVCSHPHICGVITVDVK